MKNEKEINELINILSEYGYDMLVKNNIITILKDDYVKTTTLYNVLTLINENTAGMVMPLKYVAELLMTNHKINKEIDEGKYDNLKPMSKQEFRDKLSEILKNKLI